MMEIWVQPDHHKGTWCNKILTTFYKRRFLPRQLRPNKQIQTWIRRGMTDHPWPRISRQNNTKMFKISLGLRKATKTVRIKEFADRSKPKLFEWVRVIMGVKIPFWANPCLSKTKRCANQMWQHRMKLINKTLKRRRERRRRVVTNRNKRTTICKMLNT